MRAFKLFLEVVNHSVSYFLTKLLVEQPGYPRSAQNKGYYSRHSNNQEVGISGFFFEDLIWLLQNTAAHFFASLRVVNYISLSGLHNYRRWDLFS